MFLLFDSDIPVADLDFWTLMSVSMPPLLLPALNEMTKSLSSIYEKACTDLSANEYTVSFEVEFQNVLLIQNSENEQFRS
eukprot:snap_masked-scaffold_15-processed-gene-8.41-mRNA-1 protein AED:1.00 eAED:1.00 QI:0/0/0/0/1/1/2/0/79